MIGSGFRNTTSSNRTS